MRRLTTSDNEVKQFLFRDISIEVVDEKARHDIDNLSPVAESGSYDDLTDTPLLATVATTGDYDDLIDTPQLATVATTGDYNDLNNMPTIPVVNDGTLTIQKNGVNVETFTANSNTNKTANITMTKNDVGLENVGNFKAVSTVANQGLTDDEKGNARTNIGAGSSNFSGDYNDLSNKPALKTVATSGSYNDLTDKPTIPAVNNATLTIQKNGTNVQTFTANASSNVTANITMSKSDVGLGNVGNFKAVSTVASQGLTDTEKSNARTNIDAGTSSFSGSYNDLTNKPTIPTVNNATLTIQKNGTTVKTFTANASSNVTANITVPTKTSELTNDSGYITDAGVTGIKGNSETNYRTGNVNITKSNIGLGSVPNVATNDQTPTFTQATTRANIASGEKLSVIFGKIMKVFADLKTVAFTGSYNDLSDKLSSQTASSGGTTLSLVTTGEKYTWNNKQSALSRSTGSLTAGSGITLSNVRCEKYGKVVSVFAYCGGNIATNGTLFTLPNGFRPPAKTYSIAIATINGVLANPYVDINTNGTVVATLAGSNYGVEMTFIIS